jgi:hypothetical protein
MSVQWKEHQGKPTYLSVDYRGCSTQQDMIDTFEQQVTEMRAVSASGGRTLVLSNFEGTKVGSELLDRIKQAGKERGQQSLGRNAILGISGLKNILLKGFIAYTGLHNVKPFDNETTALDWLVDSAR